MDSKPNENAAVPESPAAVTMEAFFTRQAGNEGVEFSLDLPDGTPTPHRIRIRSIDSDIFRKANAEFKRQMVEIWAKSEGVEPDSALLEELKLKLQASLVVSWTFPNPTTLAGIVNLLKEAPAIAEQIDRISGRRAVFYRAKLKSSTGSPNQNLS